MSDELPPSEEELLSEWFASPYWEEGLHKNEMSGKSFLVSPETGLDAVPKKFRHLLTEEVVAVFADPRAYFASLADKAKLPAMKQWLLAIGAATHSCLELNQGPKRSGLEDARFLFYQADDEQPHPGGEVSLVEEQPGEELPTLLQNLYSLVGRISVGGFGVAGGLLPLPLPLAEELGFGAMGDGPENPASYFSLIDTANGDMLVVNEEDAYWYSLSSMSTQYAGKLEPVLNKFFLHLLDQASFDPDNWQAV